MRIQKNEVGVTLMEVLVTIIITSFVLILVFSIFFNGLKVSNKAESNSSLQQEANYIIFALKKVHESGIDYTITVEDSKKITINKGQYNEQVIEKMKFDYEIKINGSPITFKSIKPKGDNKKISIELTIVDTKIDKEYAIKTTISRL